MAASWQLPDGGRQLTAPNGTLIRLVDADPPLVLPPLVPSLVVTRMGDDPHWGAGRAGMGYRDLIPDRQGGRFIASHIRIPEAGPVPDWVHFHKIRFQMIYCYRGWARLVYEDQGEPFILQAGDCVLQPPEIRHRVLESSAGLEVIEIGCPARHDTLADHDLPLPTAAFRPDRDSAASASSAIRPTVRRGSRGGSTVSSTGTSASPPPPTAWPGCGSSGRPACRHPPPPATTASCCSCSSWRAR